MARDATVACTGPFGVDKAESLAAIDFNGREGLMNQKVAPTSMPQDAQPNDRVSVWGQKAIPL